MAVTSVFVKNLTIDPAQFIGPTFEAGGRRMKFERFELQSDGIVMLAANLLPVGEI